MATVLEYRGRQITTEDVAAIRALIAAHPSATLEKLRKLLFGSRSEKTRKVLGDPPDGDDDDPAGGAGGDPSDDGDGDPAGSNDAKSEKEKRKGHGRRGADEYTGAERKEVFHDSLTHGGRCLECRKGRLYRQREPALLVRVRGVAPLQATVYELERLRCNLCGEVFTAKPPAGIGRSKYDETAAAMIMLLKYGCGLPFNRLERLGADLGIPLPSATQWDVVAQFVEKLEPVYDELIREAAAGDVMYIDDTYARVLELAEEIREELEADPKARTGIFTSGVVSTVGARKMALFFTGLPSLPARLTGSPGGAA